MGDNSVVLRHSNCVVCYINISRGSVRGFHVENMKMEVRLLLFIYLSVIVIPTQELDLSSNVCQQRLDLNFRIIGLECEFVSGQVYVYRGVGALKDVKSLTFNTFDPDSHLVVKKRGRLEEIIVKNGNQKLCDSNCFTILPAYAEVKVIVNGEVCKSDSILEDTLLTVPPDSISEDTLSTIPPSSEVTTKMEIITTPYNDTGTNFISPSKTKDDTDIQVWIYSSVVAAFVIVFTLIFCCWLKRRRSRESDDESVAHFEMTRTPQRLHEHTL